MKNTQNARCEHYKRNILQQFHIHRYNKSTDYQTLQLRSKENTMVGKLLYILFNNSRRFKSNFKIFSLN